MIFTIFITKVFIKFINIFTLFLNFRRLMDLIVVGSVLAVFLTYVLNLLKVVSVPGF
jgi:hypothetical protein